MNKIFKIISTVYQGFLVRNIVLLFFIGLTNLSANDWIQMNPSTNPSSRTWHDLAYIGDGKILLYGGYNNLDDFHERGRLLKMDEDLGIDDGGITYSVGLKW